MWCFNFGLITSIPGWVCQIFGHSITTNTLLSLLVIQVGISAGEMNHRNMASVSRQRMVDAGRVNQPIATSSTGPSERSSDPELTKVLQAIQSELHDLKLAVAGLQSARADPHNTTAPPAYSSRIYPRLPSNQRDRL